MPEVPQAINNSPVKEKINWKIISIILVIAVIFSGAVGYIGYTIFKLDFITNLSKDTGKTTTKKGGELSEIVVPKFSSGKIAFVKDGNLWLATPDGKTTAVASDAILDYTKVLFTKSYSNSGFSPDGNYLAYIKAWARGTENDQPPRNSLFLYDTVKGGSFFGTLGNPWVGRNNSILEKKSVEPFDNIDTLNYFYNEYSFASFSGGDHDLEDLVFKVKTNEGCGGGPATAWVAYLTKNNGGSAIWNAVRPTRIYLPDQKSLLISRGCNDEYIQIIGTKLESQRNFDTKYKREADATATRYSGTPNELVLSPKGDFLTGSLDGNIVLINLEGEVTKTLTTSGKTYAPVFSNDGSKIYYTDNVDFRTNVYGGKPILYVIDTSGKNKKELYKADEKGAIASINESPDGTQVIFTLITETISAEDEYDKKGNSDIRDGGLGKAKEDTYLINADGTGLKLFVENTGQVDWSK